MRINHTFFGGKVFKVEEKQAGSQKCVEVRLGQGYPIQGKTKEDGTQAYHNDYMTAVCWGKCAEAALKLKPQQFVTVEGRLRYNEWKDKTSGLMRNSVTINASFIHLESNNRGDAASPEETETIWVDAPKQKPEGVPF